MATQLDQILAHALLTVMKRKQGADMAGLERRASARTAGQFTAGLRRVAAAGPAVIAECKKASPSKGVIREFYDAAALARSFEGVGAAAISVLTDEEFFQGSLGDLEAVSAAVTIPVLRKDFILDKFQILEAKAAGADAILLIVAAHTDGDLRDLAAEAKRWGLDVLCEAHDREEIERAVQLGFNTIGVNCRNLKTLGVDTTLHTTLEKYLPRDVVRVAESGIRSVEDITRLTEAGYDAFLVGETLMRQPEPAAQLALLLDREFASEI